VSRSAGELVTWAEACVRALDENGITATFEGPASTAVNVRTTAGAIVTGWSSGKVSAGGPQILRDDALAVLSLADLVVGYTRGATGGMLMRLPEATNLADTEAQTARGALVNDLLDRVDDRIEDVEEWPARDALRQLRDLVALALGRPVRE
jgi:hypothetical protein